MACANDEEANGTTLSGTPSQSQFPSNPAASPTVTATAPAPGTVLQFTNPIYGYSFDYPADWSIDGDRTAASSATNEYVVVSRPGSTTGAERVEFVVLENPYSLSLDQWIAEYRDNSPSLPKVESTEAVTVKDGVGIREILSARGFTFFSAYFALGNRVLLVNGPWVDSPILPVYEDMLVSLRLTP
jgi:hypothetical protein